MKTQEQRIQDYLDKNGNRDPELIRCNLKQHGPPVPMSVIRQFLSRQPGGEEISTPQKDLSIKGINLTNVRVSHKKPNEGLKAKFYQLQKGKGYPLDALSREWCATEDTIRNQAKRLDCIKYVEVNPGEWVACILHPDTATTYKS